MNRCLLSSLIATPLLAAAFSCAAENTPQTLPAPLPQIEVPVSAAAHKAGQRNFPNHAFFGVLRMDPVPNAQLNGESVRTAPGFRLFNAENRLIFAHTVQGEALKVAYVKEASTGWLLTAWILTPQELQSFPTKR